MTYNEAAKNESYVQKFWERGSAMRHSRAMKKAIDERAALVLQLNQRGINWKSVLEKGRTCADS